MKCIYPNGEALTKEQTEAVQRVIGQVGELFQKVWDAIADLIKTISQSEGFKDLMKLLEGIDTLPANTGKLPSPKLAFNKIPFPEPPMLDKRMHLHVIRSNC